MKISFSLFYTFLVISFQYSFGQVTDTKKSPLIIGKANAISVGTSFPIGDFAATHTFGFQAEYSRCRYGYGKMQLPNKFSYLLNAGINHIRGKNVFVSSYPYRYPAYTSLHLFAGGMYFPAPSFIINISTGPAVNFYNKEINLSLGAKLETNYFIKDRLAISPALIMLKKNGSNSLWLLTTKGTWAF
jgi:hypothetical protein